MHRRRWGAPAAATACSPFARARRWQTDSCTALRQLLGQAVGSGPHGLALSSPCPWNGPAIVASRTERAPPPLPPLPRVPAVLKRASMETRAWACSQHPDPQAEVTQLLGAPRRGLAAACRGTVCGAGGGSGGGGKWGSTAVRDVHSIDRSIAARGRTDVQNSHSRYGARLSPADSRDPIGRPSMDPRQVLGQRQRPQAARSPCARGCCYGGLVLGGLPHPARPGTGSQRRAVRGLAVAGADLPGLPPPHECGRLLPPAAAATRRPPVAPPRTGAGSWCSMRPRSRRPASRARRRRRWWAATA